MSRSLLSPKMTFKTTGSLKNTLTDGSMTQVSHPALNYAVTLTSGVSDNQANRAWQAISRSIVSGEQETINLRTFAGINLGSGAGNDGLGQAMDLEELVMIVIVNENEVTDAGQLEVLPASSEGWDGIGSHTVANGGALLGQGILIKANPAEAGFALADGSDRITLRASGGDVDYSLYVFGRSDTDESSSSSSSSSSFSSFSSSQSSSSSSSSSSSISTSSISTSSSCVSTSSSCVSTSSSSHSSSSWSSQSTSSSSSSSSSSESSSSLSS